jgi:hypothetical protein
LIGPEFVPKVACRKAARNPEVSIEIDIGVPPAGAATTGHA